MGIAFGRTGTRGPGRNKNNSTVSYHLIPGQQNTARFWLNTTSEDIRCFYDSDGSRHWEVLNGITTDASLPAQRSDVSNISLPLSHFPSLAEIDRFLFHYCTLALVNHEPTLTTPSQPHLHHPKISRRLRQPMALSPASTLLPVRRSPPYGHRMGRAYPS